MPSRSRKSIAITHVGKVRESNQDAYVCRNEIGLWAVADGMGGHEAGDLASQIVASRLEEITPCDCLDDLRAKTRKALESANSELIGMVDQFSPGRAPGSTVAVLLIRDRQGVIYWAGDSRIYRLRDCSLEQLTRDHSHIQSLLDEEMIKPEDAELHPMAHLITRAVGLRQPLALESAQLEVDPGDRYLLCSDGLSRVLPLVDIETIMNTQDLGAAVQSMMTATLDQGAPDNVTVIGVDHES